MEEDIKILLVEDDVFACEEAEEYLSLLYGKVLIAHDGEEGLKLYEEEKPNILIVDHIMPKLNGLDMIRIIRKTNKQIPIILTTSDTRPETVFASTDVQLIKYLIKPMSNKKFKDVLTLVTNEYLKTKNSFIIIDKGKNIIYNYFDKVLEIDKTIITLTNNEIIFIELLLDNTHRIVLYNEIFEVLWKDEYYGDGEGMVDKDRVRTLVSNLRKKVKEISIKNLSGTGYKLLTNL